MTPEKITTCDALKFVVRLIANVLNVIGADQRETQVATCRRMALQGCDCSEDGLHVAECDDITILLVKEEIHIANEEDRQTLGPYSQQQRCY